MERINLDRQWNFQLSGTPQNPWPESRTVVVDLPHDFSIIQKRDPNTPSGANTGFFPGGIGKYEKTLFVPEDWKGKKVFLEFEGAYMNTTVRFNSQIVTHHPYGYTSFHCDLTPYLIYGKDNLIQVTVNNSALPNSRWYSGSGIYRHVWLLVGESVHISPWGVYVTTPEVSLKASTVSVKTTVENSEAEPADIAVRSIIIDADGRKVASDEVNLKIDPAGKIEAAQILTVSPAKLWSIENPYLYSLLSIVLRNGIVIDSVETRFGIRSISVDAQEGFKLNGVPIKLKGGCVHHDCGLLGAAAYDRAEERKIELLKASGYNAIRCAHNPPSPAFLDACDRLGMLVMDEAFDCWREEKTSNGYSDFFEEYWEKDLASMVLRDRNHPSVIMWSTGNEIPERDGRSDGYNYARKLADFVRSLDPTRPVTNALCNVFSNEPLVNAVSLGKYDLPEDFDNWGELTRKFAEPLDVVGYNYLLDRYESDGKKFPNRIICGTETFPKEIFDFWETVERLPYVIGDFVWTSLDYLGEAGIGRVRYKGETGHTAEYPWHHAYCGDIDICGFKRPQSYYRDCVWGVSKAPYIAVYKPENYGKPHVVSLWGWPDVESSWTWPGFEGKLTGIEVYCSDDEVELILNGKSLGRKPAGKANRYKAFFETPYVPGELVAIGFCDGREVSRTTLKTAGAPASIRLTPDRAMLKAKFGDLSYVTVEVLDKEGNVVHNADTNIFFTVCGVGTLLAVGSGNPITREMYIGNQRRVYYGKAMAVVRANGDPGEITLTASADGIPPASVIIKVG